MRRVILESPYAGDVDGNLIYARACVRDSLLRHEAPIASHLLYTQPGILNDDDQSERQHGIDAGLAWGMVADATVVYIDKGISRGMQYGIGKALKQKRPVEYRALNVHPKPGTTVLTPEMLQAAADECMAYSDRYNSPEEIERRDRALRECIERILLRDH